MIGRAFRLFLELLAAAAAIVAIPVLVGLFAAAFGVF